MSVRDIYIRDDAGKLRSVGTEWDEEFPAGDGDSCGSGIIISYGVNIQEGLRGRGIGQKAHVERLNRFRGDGYNYVLCTVRRDNDAQLHILKKHGWVRLANTASADGTPIYLMGRNLK